MKNPPEHLDQPMMKLQETVPVWIRLGSDGKMPVYATKGSAGCDLVLSRDMTLLPGMTRLLPLDFIMALPPGVEAQIRPRSGLSLRTDLRLPNSPGTIDSDYRDPVAVLMQNTFSSTALPDRILAEPELYQQLQSYRLTTYGAFWQEKYPVQAPLPDSLARMPLYLDPKGNPYGTIYLQAGERVAQMVFCRYLSADFQKHEQPETIGRNRGGGFGSTGRQSL